MIHTSSDREILVERTFDAPRDKIWRALTEPALIAQWWGRGHKLVVTRLEPEPGGHWRFVSHGPDAKHGFEGRFRELTPPERLVQTFEWDGKPGHVVIQTATLDALPDNRTQLRSVSLFHTTEERDGMLASGMEQGLAESHAALDRLLAAGLPPPQPARAIRRVAFTLYPATDIPRARRFYEDTLGLTVGMAGGRGDMHWIEYDLPGGGCLAITNTTGAKPDRKAGGTIALEVADLDALVQHLRDAGTPFHGDIIRGPRCRMAFCEDSEGNPLVLHQLDKKT